MKFDDSTFYSEKSTLPEHLQCYQQIVITLWYDMIYIQDSMVSSVFWYKDWVKRNKSILLIQKQKFSQWLNDLVIFEIKKIIIIFEKEKATNLRPNIIWWNVNLMNNENLISRKWGS